jgi:hypothetical protein
MNDSLIAALRYLMANPESDPRYLEKKYGLGLGAVAAGLFAMGGRKCLSEDRMMRAKYGIVENISQR